MMLLPGVSSSDNAFTLPAMACAPEFLWPAVHRIPLSFCCARCGSSAPLIGFCDCTARDAARLLASQRGRPGFAPAAGLRLRWVRLQRGLGRWYPRRSRCSSRSRLSRSIASCLISARSSITNASIAAHALLSASSPFSSSARWLSLSTNACSPCLSASVLTGFVLVIPLSWSSDRAAASEPCSRS